MYNLRFEILDLKLPAVVSVFYNCRGSSTNRPYFMQNKANLRKSQMNINIFYKKDYENISDWTPGENKPKQSQFQIVEKLLALESIVTIITDLEQT